MLSRVLQWMMLCSVGLFVNGGDVRDFPVFDQIPPTRPPADIWLEGESASVRSRFGVENNAASYGGSALMSFSREADCLAAWEFKVDQPGEYLVAVAGAPVGLGHVSPIAWRMDDGAWHEVKSLSRSGHKWGTADLVHWTNLAVIELAVGTHRLEWRVTAPREDGIYCNIVDAIAMIRDPYRKYPPKPEMMTKVPGNVFQDGMPVRFYSRYPVAAADWFYEVTDWRGTGVAKGTWNYAEPLELKNIPHGFYQLRARPVSAKAWECELPFTVIFDSNSGKRIAHSFAVDGAPSWMSGEDLADPIRPPDTQNVTARLEQLAGIGMVRDRINWVMTPEGTIDWTSNPAVAAVKAAHGLEVCGMIQTAPSWMVNQTHIPVDLLATWKFGKAAAEKYRGQITAWEFWNEPDGSSIPPWEFASAQKAMYLGMKAGEPSVKVLNGSSCLHPVPLYMDIAMSNGLSEYFDLYNFHTYEAIGQLAASVRDERALLERHGVGGKPMWVTENGYSAIGQIQPYRRSQKWEHNLKTELDQAEYVAKAQIALLTAGVDRTFSFLFAPFNEGGADGNGGKIMGLLRWDFAAKAGYTALATLIDQLAGAEYLGELVSGKNSSLFLFETLEKEQIVVCWSNDQNQHEYRLPGSKKTVSMVDMLGQRSVLNSATDGSIIVPIERFPVFVRGEFGLTPDRPAEKPTQPAFTNAYGDLSVVLSLKLDEQFELDKTKAVMKDGHSGSGILTIWNFDQVAKNGSILVKDQEFTVDGALTGITVAPMSKVEIPISITTRPETFGFGALEFSGQFNGKEISPLYLLIKTGNLAENDQIREVRLPIENPKRWHENSAGKMSIDHDAEKKAVSLFTEFPANADLWTYPEFMLAKDESFADAIGFSFELQANKEISFALIMLMTGEVGDKSAQSCWINYRPTTQWQTITVMFDVDLPRSVPPKTIRVVRIGANPWHESKEDSQYRFWVRNFKVYYPVK